MRIFGNVVRRGSPKWRSDTNEDAGTADEYSASLPEHQGSDFF